MSTDPVDTDQIELLARALFAALAPITGTRATGTVTVTALGIGPGNAVLPPNTYLRPVVRGELREDLLFKTVVEWTVALGDTEAGVRIMSNLGGKRHSLPAGTVLRFDPVPDGFARDVTLDADTIGGTDDGAMLKDVVFFEDVDSANPEQDIFKAVVRVPAILLVWGGSDPVDGVADGLQQGATRRQRGVRSFRESFAAYVVSGRLTDDPSRRREGLLIAQAISRLWTDRYQNDDGEQLSTIGAGVEITGRSRYRRGENTYIYVVTLRTNQTLEKAPDARTFNRWLRTRSQGAVPGNPAPEPTAPMTIVDAKDTMP